MMEGLSQILSLMELVSYLLLLVEYSIITTAQMEHRWLLLLLLVVLHYYMNYFESKIIEILAQQK